MLAVRHINIQSPHWEGAPLTIGLMADIHIGGRHVSAERVAKIVSKMNALSPDIVLLAGDYVDGHVKADQHTDAFNAEIDTGLRYLGGLKAPLGVYASLGNHDAWYDTPRLSKGFQAGGIIVLDNQHMVLPNNGTDICLVGLADYYTGKSESFMFDGCGNDQNIIAFMHSPDSFKLMRSDTALALAGHTHGGQINLPLLGRRVTSTDIGHKFAYGKMEWGGIPAFVTAGIGTSILSARFRARPELVIITLSAQQ